MKIIVDKKVRAYELTFLLRSDLTSAEIKKIQESLVALVAKHKGELKSQTEWGKKALAYTIKSTGKRYTEADFFHWVIQFETSHLAKFEHDLRLEQAILRYLLVLARETGADKAESNTNYAAEENR